MKNEMLKKKKNIKLCVIVLCP